MVVIVLIHNLNQQLNHIITLTTNINHYIMWIVFFIHINNQYIVLYFYSIVKDFIEIMGQNIGLYLFYHSVTFHIMTLMNLLIFQMVP